MQCLIHKAEPEDAREVAVLMGEFLNEMMSHSKTSIAHFSLSETEAIIKEFLECGDYVVLIARSVRHHPLGYLNLFEMRTQYKGGQFGIMNHIYVRPEYRRRHIARRLVEQAKTEARAQRWKYLELTMPAYFPLPEARLFFQNERFVGIGERKQKLNL